MAASKSLLWHRHSRCLWVCTVTHVCSYGKLEVSRNGLPATRLQLDVPTPSCHLLSRSLASQRLTDVANPVKAPPPSRNQDKVQFLSICLAISCLIGGVGVELCPVITGPLGARLGPFLLFRMQTIIRGSAALPKKKHFAVSPRPPFRRPN